MITHPEWTGSSGRPMAERPAHRAWLMDQAGALIRFHRRHAINPAGGFFTLDGAGNPRLEAPRGQGVMRELHDTCRMVHCYAAAELLGHLDAADVVDHGVRFLLERHRDPVNGGYAWGVDDAGALRPDRQAYGHAFVLLAAASAGAVEHPSARALHEDVFEVILTRFWEAEAGVMKEEFTPDWLPLSAYRGQNSNMHMTEALMAAYETWGDARCLEMARAIAGVIIGRHARAEGWVVAEHFHGDWSVDHAYAGDPMFRPAGTTPGHALEWARLLIQLWHLGGQQDGWMPEAARGLFERAIALGWAEETGGFHYTLDWSGAPDRRHRYWWPCAEGAAAAAVLGASLGDATFEEWYRRIWRVIDTGFIDHAAGGWWPEIDADNAPVETVFVGKPDIYHALQACLIPLVPSDAGLLAGLRRL